MNPEEKDREDILIILDQQVAKRNVFVDEADIRRVFLTAYERLIKALGKQPLSMSERNHALSQLVDFCIGEFEYRNEYFGEKEAGDSELSLLSSRAARKLLASRRGEESSSGEDLFSYYDPLVATLVATDNYFESINHPLSRINPDVTLMNDLFETTFKQIDSVMKMISMGLYRDAFSAWRNIHESECIVKILVDNGDQVRFAYKKHLAYNNFYRNKEEFSKEELDEAFLMIKEEMKEHDLKSKDNAINQFISYHLVPFRVSYDLLCVHFDEMGYNITLPNQLTCDIWAYYLTMDQRRMFKITHTHTDGVYHINRHSFRDNSFNGSYNETSCDREGITIVDNNGTNKNNALNGYYYPIKGILIYDNGVPNSVLNERIRYNIAQNMPELMSNGLRHPATKGPNYYIPTKYQYVKNVIAQNCDMDYRTVLSSGNNGWQGIEGDQFAWRGSNMTMTIKLMPVPYSGTWEIRWGVSHLDSRGLVQVYIGTDPQRMQAVGLPFDLRPTSADVRIAKGDQTDFGGDTLLAIENDQQMRNLYNMKGPKQYCQNRTTTAHTVPLRDRLLTCRRILYRGYLDHNKTYWIKFKTCLDISSLELFGNYVELCPKNVWDNPLLNEDIW